MQVIRGGRMEVTGTLADEHSAIASAFEAGDLRAAKVAIEVHIETGRRLAIEALELSGGLL